MLTLTVLHCETNANSKKLLTLINNSYDLYSLYLTYTHGLIVIIGT